MRTDRSAGATFAALAAGLIAASGAGTAAHAADGAHGEALKAVSEPMPRGAPASNGAAMATGNDGGKPQIDHQGVGGSLGVGVPVAAGGDQGRPAVEYGPQPAAGVAAAAPAGGQDAPPSATAPAGVDAMLQEARDALRSNHPDVARNRLERAETALLNARAGGEHAFRDPIRDIAGARAALARGHHDAAEHDLGSAMRSLDRAD